MRDQAIVIWLVAIGGLLIALQKLIIEFLAAIPIFFGLLGFGLWGLAFLITINSEEEIISRRWAPPNEVDSGRRVRWVEKGGDVGGSRVTRDSVSSPSKPKKKKPRNWLEETFG